MQPTELTSCWTTIHGIFNQLLRKLLHVYYYFRLIMGFISFLSYFVNIAGPATLSSVAILRAKVLWKWREDNNKLLNSFSGRCRYKLKSITPPTPVRGRGNITPPHPRSLEIERVQCGWNSVIDTHRWHPDLDNRVDPFHIVRHCRPAQIIKTTC